MSAFIGFVIKLIWHAQCPMFAAEKERFEPCRFTGKGEQEKTIKYRFFEAKEPKQGAQEASVSSDTGRLCDASGGEALQISPSPYFLSAKDLNSFCAGSPARASSATAAGGG